MRGLPHVAFLSKLMDHYGLTSSPLSPSTFRHRHMVTDEIGEILEELFLINK